MFSKENSSGSGPPCSETFEVNHTWLRPSWDAFWAVKKEETIPSLPGTRSTLSTKSEASVLRRVQLVSGSTWAGEWDKLGMCGAGEYRMPHGVTYEGTMSADIFEGFGILKYPNGGKLEGLWCGGKLKYCKYNYADGMKRENLLPWPYCTMPDRRFYSEQLGGLRPADTEQLTHDHPPRRIPPGHYNVGDGFYSPRSKCVVDCFTGDILRIPTVAEEKWILDNCRQAEVRTVGFHPELYENWFQETPECSIEKEEGEKEILELILQEGLQLDSSTISSGQDTYTNLQSKLDSMNFRELMKTSSETMLDFELFLKRILKELIKTARKTSSKEVLSLVKSKAQSKEEYSDDPVSILQDVTPFQYEKGKAEVGENICSKMAKKSLYDTLHECGDVQQLIATQSYLSSDPCDLTGSQVHYRVDYNDCESTGLSTF